MEIESNLLLKGDSKGALISLEQYSDISFEIKRVFYIFDTKNSTIRGEHSHYNTKQFLIAVSGSCNIDLDDGENITKHILDRPTKGLYHAPMVWGKMYDFSSDCVLLVLADTLYNEEDYIRDYNFFKKIKNLTNNS